MPRYAIVYSLLGILLFFRASPAAEQTDSQKREDAIDLLSNLIKRTVPTASVSVYDEGSEILLAGSVAHVEDIDTVMNVARAVWEKQKGQVICGLKVGGLEAVQIDLKLYRVDRAEAERVDEELFRRYSGSFGKEQVVSENEHQLDEVLLQDLESIGQAEFLTETHTLTMSGRLADGFDHAGDSRVPDLTGFGHEWIIEEHLKGNLQFRPVILPAGRVRLSIEMKYPDRKVVRLGTPTLADGQTVVLAAPDDELDVQPLPDAGDFVMLATVHVVPVAP